MKLALTTSTFGKTPFDEALERISGHGFRAIEITAIPGGPHLDAAKITPQEVEALRQRLQQLRLEVVAIMTCPIGPFGEPHYVSYIKRAIDLAVALECPDVLFFSRKPPDMDRYTEAELRSDLTKKMRSIADYALDKRIHLAFETEPGLFVESPRQALEILAEINHPALGYNLCVPHILSAGENVEDVIEQGRERIFHTHMSDLQDRIHRHLIPGLGNVNLADIVSRLQVIGYQGALSFDLYPYVDTPDEAAAKTYEYMARLLGG